MEKTNCSNNQRMIKKSTEWNEDCLVQHWTLWIPVKTTIHTITKSIKVMQVQSAMAESLHVLPQIHPPKWDLQGDAPIDSLSEWHPKILNPCHEGFELFLCNYRLIRWRSHCLWLQYTNICQSQLAVDKIKCNKTGKLSILVGNAPTKVQSQNGRTFEWSQKNCHVLQEIELMIC